MEKHKLIETKRLRMNDKTGVELMEGISKSNFNNWHENK